MGKKGGKGPPPALTPPLTAEMLQSIAMLTDYVEPTSALRACDCARDRAVPAHTRMTASPHRPHLPALYLGLCASSAPLPPSSFGEIARFNAQRTHGVFLDVFFDWKYCSVDNISYRSQGLG